MADESIDSYVDFLGNPIRVDDLVVFSQAYSTSSTGICIAKVTKLTKKANGKITIQVHKLKGTSKYSLGRKQTLQTNRHILAFKHHVIDELENIE